MNMLSTRWFSEQEIEENSIIQQFHMNSLVGEVHEAQYTLPHSFPTNFDPSYDDLVEMKPSKILKTTYILPQLPPPHSSPLPPNSKPHLHHQPSSTILSFENAGSHVMDHEYSPTYLNSIFSSKVEVEVPPNRNSEPRKETKRVQPLPRSQSNAQDHIIAERKRREKLTQRFVALSALVPGLKKMDKASVLGDALKHIKYLQEKVGELEEQKKERRLESMVLVKKSKLILDDNNQSSSSSSCEDGSEGMDLPEIEVRFSDKDVLIKILCEKQKGHIAKIMAEIEKFRFSITNSSVLPFGPTLDITIVAKESDFDMTLMDVVKSLRSALSKFM
ncbi:transcription factor bHLH25 isoform X2 [Capsella rubella]|uniref:transcription factor bHLH25 isoform X2 n=1 Tax=Capsella rubella TaxID=81985 RepID=UPI000CD5C4CE|nr:transcription factor bHLH25 isoform X2 [Capsella rubella]